MDLASAEDVFKCPTTAGVYHNHRLPRFVVSQLLTPSDGRASGSLVISFDADGDGTIDVDELATLGVDADSLVAQEALQALEGLLLGVEVSVDEDSEHRARNGGTWRRCVVQTYTLLASLGGSNEFKTRW